MSVIDLNSNLFINQLSTYSSANRIGRNEVLRYSEKFKDYPVYQGICSYFMVDDYTDKEYDPLHLVEMLDTIIDFNDFIHWVRKAKSLSKKALFVLNNMLINYRPSKLLTFELVNGFVITINALHK